MKKITLKFHKNKSNDGFSIKQTNSKLFIKHIVPVIGFICVFALVCLSIFSVTKISNEASALPLKPDQKPSFSLNTSSDIVDFGQITPNSSSVSTTTLKTLVSTEVPNGYKIILNTKDANTCLRYWQLNTDSCNVIESFNKVLAGNPSLVVNTWAWSNNNGENWQIPQDNTGASVFADKSGSPAIDDETVITFGAKVDIGLAAGQYNNTLVVTALPEPISSPSITTVSPNSGESDTTIEITGENFNTTYQVFIDLNNNGTQDEGEQCTNASIDSNTQITCDTPTYNSAGSFTVIIKTWGGTASKSNGFEYISSGPTVTSISPNSGPMVGGTTVTITGENFGTYVAPTTTDYPTCGAPQTFTAPADGMYELEVWGAQGGRTGTTESDATSGGKGGYSTGQITLNSSDELYIYVGCAGAANGVAGWNGGGAARSSGNYTGGGGGATDIRLAQNVDPLDITSLQSRILVAGAGGGHGRSVSDTNFAGAGGGLNGTSAGIYTTASTGSTGGTQNSGGLAGYLINTYNSSTISTGFDGTFGIGGAGSDYSYGGYSHYGAGGGGGWYGGGGGSTGTEAYGSSDGAGGSGYTFTSTSDKTGYGDNIPNNSFYLSHATTVDGTITNGMPDPVSTNGIMMTGKTGDGYARITQHNTGSYVTLGGAVCKIVSWSDTSITCVTKFHDMGTVDVVVTNSSGEDGSLDNSYIYSGPIISSICRIGEVCDDVNGTSSGHFRGGETFVVTGENFTGAIDVSFVHVSGEFSSCHSLIVINNTTIRCVSSGVPANLQAPETNGSGSYMINSIEIMGVKVTTTGGTDLKPNLFTYRYIDSSFTTGGSFVEMKGSDFALGTKFGVGTSNPGTICKDQKVISSNIATCVTPQDLTPGTKNIQTTVAPSYYANMQNFSESCSAPYGTIRVLRDTRDNQNYRVRCMEDGKWWMIDNLKLAGGTALTSANTNLTGTQATDFVTIWASLSSPVQGVDTHSNGKCTNDSSVQQSSGNGFLTCDGLTAFNTDNDGFVAYSDPSKATNSASWVCNNQIMINKDSLTNCGYLYNWYTTTAGNGKYETSTTSATSSICPAGWHLPYNTLTNDFGVLNGSMLIGSPSSSSDANSSASRPNWFYNGKFQGAMSGYYGQISSAFTGQGSSGYYWSAMPSDNDSARILRIMSNQLIAGSNTSSRSIGHAIRCTI